MRLYSFFLDIPNENLRNFSHHVEYFISKFGSNSFDNDFETDIDNIKPADDLSSKYYQ